MKNQTYSVQWRIELIASSPEDAAAQALKMHREASDATVFHVRPFNSRKKWQEIDAAVTEEKDEE